MAIFQMKSSESGEGVENLVSGSEEHYIFLANYFVHGLQSHIRRTGNEGIFLLGGTTESKYIANILYTKILHLSAHSYSHSHSHSYECSKFKLLTRNSL